MDNNLIITISREFGSGGHAIGEQLANELNIPFYDKNIIEKTAEETGFTPDFISEHEQKYTNSLLFNLAMGNYSRTGELPLHDQIDIAESNVIKTLASKGSCVIVGRCADYILEDDYNCLNVFIYSDFMNKIQRITELYSIDAQRAEHVIKDSNKRRSKHYSYFTGKVWGDRDNYNLMIDTGKYGIEGSVNLIHKAIELMK